MAQQHKSKKKQTSQQEQQHYVAAQKEKQGRVKKIFTVIICVVVALGLMLPIAGIGATSCSAQVSDEQGSVGNSSNESNPLSNSND
jgi:ABC-type Fe3+ transport system permease subunit